MNIKKILNILKKNIYLVCLILALSYIAYNKLEKKEGLENNDCKKCFGEKHAKIENIDTPNPMIINLNERSDNDKFWIDLNSIKVNGSKHLAIVDANQYDVVKKRLNTCEDINVQNINLKKSINNLNNRGFFARLFNQ
jgi:hypothetical protein